MVEEFWVSFRRALWKAFDHNIFTMAKAAAYSQILSIFPALLVATTLLSFAPQSDTVRVDVRSLLLDILPPDTMNLAQSYFAARPARSQRLLVSASVVAIAAATGVMLSLMEGFRRAYGLPRSGHGFWKERLVAFALIPSTLLPMLFATAFVVFGHQIELWMVENTDHAIGFLVLTVWRFVRWLIAMGTSVAVLMVLYHFATSVRQAWLRVLPGAVLATMMWFAATMLYGWYVTRFADYSIVYGPLGAGVATMVWLYIISLAVLIGAEYNAQVHPLLPLAEHEQDPAASPKVAETLPPTAAPSQALEARG